MDAVLHATTNGFSLIAIPFSPISSKGGVSSCSDPSLVPHVPPPSLSPKPGPPPAVATVLHQLWLVRMQVSVPYLRSEYGKDYDFDAPVKLLDSMMHAMADQPNQQVVVLGQVRLSISSHSCTCLPSAGHRSLLGQPVRQGCDC